MSKTLSPVNKESLIVLIFIFGILSMLAVNLWFLVPSFLDTIITKTELSQNGPIDAQTVNEAIKYLNNE